VSQHLGGLAGTGRQAADEAGGIKPVTPFGEFGPGGERLVQRGEGQRPGGGQIGLFLGQIVDRTVQNLHGGGQPAG
jgi:hypothetical protein